MALTAWTNNHNAESWTTPFVEEHKSPSYVSAKTISYHIQEVVNLFPSYVSLFYHKKIEYYNFQLTEIKKNAFKEA